MFSFINYLFNHKNKYKLYYFGGKKNKNAGDIYNVDLMKYFGIPYTRKRKIQQANLICVGSNLDKLAEQSKTELLIIGAGFIFPPTPDDCLNRNVKVLALRGNLSKLRMENLMKQSLDNCVLGDLGLLASKIYPNNVQKKYKLGIIPHYSEKTDFNKGIIKLLPNEYKIIDIQQDVKFVVEEICQCECILSSSLHGLIFADSYNIPNRQLIISNKLAGGNYKFEDYYSAFDLSLPKSVDAKNSFIDENLVKEIISSYSSKNIVKIQNDLIKIFEQMKQ